MVASAPVAAHLESYQPPEPPQDEKMSIDEQ
jgi:hypothetical protein